MTVFWLALVLACCAAAPPNAPAPDPLDQAAIEAVKNGKLIDFSKQAEAELEPVLDPHTPKDLDRLTHLAALREFGRYFSRLPKARLSASESQVLQWLPTEPKLLNTLMLAIGNTDAPDRVLAIMAELYLDMGDHLADWPDLTAAICVVWDSPAVNRHAPADADKIDVERPRKLMRYYTNTRDRLQFDPQHVPWQLLVYVVDNVVTEPEITWALDRYGRRGNIGATYFDVPYDFNAFYGSGANQQDAKGRTYTLPNLVLFGGVCADQAYFATQVGRSVGVPTAPADGQSGSGAAPHAWVGYFNVQGDHAAWDFEQGRYPEYRFFKGRVIDPQTRQNLNESDISLLAELWDTEPAKRMASVAMTKTIDLVDPSRKAASYMQAINLSPGNRQAWLELANLGEKNKLTAQQSKELKDVITQFAVRRYPDFAFAVLKQSISGRGFDQQLDALDEIGKMFDQTRPDLLANLDAEKAELLQKSHHPAEAMAIYGDAIERYGSSGAVAMDLMEHIDKFLRETGDLARLADIYQYVWQHQAQPEPSAYVQITPFFLLGERYEQVLKDLDETNDVQVVRARLDSLRASAQSMAPHDK